MLYCFPESKKEVALHGLFSGGRRLPDAARGGRPVIRVAGIRLPPGHPDDAPLLQALKRARLKQEQVASWRISRKSVDARDKGRVWLVYALDLEIRGDESALLSRVKHPEVVRTQATCRLQVPAASAPEQPVVAGLGPCGLFLALYLARAGRMPLVMERGLPVERRARSVNRLMAAGELDPESNLLFGEGGAGAFSDGKLTTGIKDPLCREVLETLAEHGAPESILYLQRPHVGTDVLPRVVSSIRREIERLGGRVLFGARLLRPVFDSGRLVGVDAVLAEKRAEIPCGALALAIGHSARDTHRELAGLGLAMTPKPFSIGLRIEHPQALINAAQYGDFADRGLPPAEYHLATRLKDGRGAYTFCMCPGGRVVPACGEEGGVNVNGMSSSRRDGENANAALLVEVRPEDYGGGADPLAGFGFQRRYEEMAFRLGGGGFRAPFQLAGDFLKGQASTSLGNVKASYKPGVTAADLAQALPAFAAEGIREAILQFDRKIKGFALPDAVLTGVETRSSCPVQVARSARFETSLNGVYAAGEGAGRAGGILSAAVDGLRCAMAMTGHEG